MPRHIRGGLLTTTVLLILASAHVPGQGQASRRQEGNTELERLFKEDQADPRRLGTAEQAAQTIARPYGKTDLGFASHAGYAVPARAQRRAAYKGGRS